jgi:small subunit ribosomal protein S17
MNREVNALLNIPALIVGRVTTINAKQKTIKVSVERAIKHPLYGKVLRRTKKINAHWDNEQNIELGNMVAVMECRPISKFKRHTFVKKIT